MDFRHQVPVPSMLFETLGITSTYSICTIDETIRANNPLFIPIFEIMDPDLPFIAGIQFTIRIEVVFVEGVRYFAQWIAIAEAFGNDELALFLPICGDMECMACRRKYIRSECKLTIIFTLVFLCRFQFSPDNMIR